MKILTIEGGRPLDGSVRAQGSKNSVLPIMAASLLIRGTTVLHNCPDIRDVDAAMTILRHLGCRAERREDDLLIDASGATGCGSCR